MKSQFWKLSRKTVFFYSQNSFEKTWRENAPGRTSSVFFIRKEESNFPLHSSSSHFRLKWILDFVFFNSFGKKKEPSLRTLLFLDTSNYNLTHPLCRQQKERTLFGKRKTSINFLIPKIEGFLPFVVCIAGDLNQFRKFMFFFSFLFFPFLIIFIFTIALNNRDGLKKITKQKVLLAEIFKVK